jgi:hypothetical protein
MKYIDQMSWQLLVLMCLTLGLAPFNPPHIWEKLLMLSKGTLVKPIDWFDLLMHGTPWFLLLLKLFVSIRHQMKV